MYADRRQKGSAGSIVERLCGWAMCALALSCSMRAAAQDAQPGDIIVERQVMPRDAFTHVPRADNPVLARATTFPAKTFDASIATLVSDVDLTNARGSGGIAAGADGSAAGLAAATTLLAGSAAASRAAGGTGALGQGPTPGIGATISSSVTGALAPLGAALGAMK